MEDVSFTYSKITWSYTDGNIEFTDDWKNYVIRGFLNIKFPTNCTNPFL